MATVTRTEAAPSALSEVVKDPKEIIASMSKANGRMAEKLGDAIKQLRADREQFQYYAECHRQKQTEDGDAKQAINQDIVNTIDALLEKLTPSV